MAATSQASLLGLPKDIRLIIYDILLKELTILPKDFETYVLYTDWPGMSVSIVRSLALTCTTFVEEVTAHFGSQHLQRAVLYFNNVPELHDFCQRVAQKPKAYQRIRICLYNCPSLFSCTAILDDEEKKEVASGITYSVARPRVDWDVKMLMRGQPGVPESCISISGSPMLVGLCNEKHNRDAHEETQDQRSSQSRRRSTRVIEQHTLHGRLYDVLSLPMSRASGTKISVHQLCGHASTCYAVMTARACDVQFEGPESLAFGLQRLAHARQILAELRKALESQRSTLTPEVIEWAFESME